MSAKRHFTMSPDEREFFLKAAVDHYSENRLDECEALLHGIIAVDPDDSRPWKLLGASYVLRDKLPAARQAYEQALELDPRDPFTLVALAEIAVNTLRLDDALPLLERLFALDPDGVHSAVNRGRRLLDEIKAELGA